MTSFSQLGLAPTLCAALEGLDHRTPTAVQALAIPHILRGGDLLVRAHTGTGKTAAFGLPIIERLRQSSSRARQRPPRALVLVPTRELAVQVHRMLASFGAADQLRVAAVYGGVGMLAQIRTLQRGTDIVVATPGRLIDHLDRRTIDLSAVDVLTLDEADRMLDLGFLPALRRVIPVLSRARQTLLFSATLPDAVVQLSSEFTRDAVRLDVSGGEVVTPTVTHQVHVVPADQKRATLARLLAEAGTARSLVFCRTRRGSDRVGEYLEDAGIKAAVIHGDKTQGARMRALDAFRNGRVTVLVATDIAARGLDIVQLPLVINFDLPLVAEDYVHRIGRTGRAGREGRAVSLMSPADAPLFRAIERLLPAPIAVAGGSATVDTSRAAGVAVPRGPRSGRLRHTNGSGAGNAQRQRPSATTTRRPRGSAWARRHPR